MKTKTKLHYGLIVAFLSFFIIQLHAQPGVLPTLPTPSGPVTEITFEETEYDFGKIMEGTKVTQVFTFTNTGDEPLLLTNARGSCGCTVPKWPRQPIRPGETASITVEFNSKNKRGLRRQKVTITANTNPAETFLYLGGEVISTDEKITVSPTKEEEAPKLSPDCFVIFPNPTADLLKLEVDKASLGERAIISIFSNNGQLMARKEIEVLEGPVEFNVNHYPAGNYVANVQIGNSKPESRCFAVTK